MGQKSHGREQCCEGYISELVTPLVFKNYACRVAPLRLCGTHLFAHELAEGEQHHDSGPNGRDGNSFFGKQGEMGQK